MGGNANRGKSVSSSHFPTCYIWLSGISLESHGLILSLFRYIKTFRIETSVCPVHHSVLFLIVEIKSSLEVKLDLLHLGPEISMWGQSAMSIAALLCAAVVAKASPVLLGAAIPLVTPVQSDRPPPFVRREQRITGGEGSWCYTGQAASS